MLFLCTKLKLIYLQRVGNLCILILFFLTVKEGIDKDKETQDYRKYVDSYNISQYSPAKSEMKDNFDKIILDAGLTINDKNIEYSEFTELENVEHAIYQLSLSGTYLQFLEYLETLHENDMLHNLSEISFIVKSSQEIIIKMNIESLYRA